MRTRNITPVLHNVYGVLGNTFANHYRNNYINNIKYGNILVCRTLTPHNYHPARHGVGRHPSYRTVHICFSESYRYRFWVPYGRTHI